MQRACASGLKIKKILFLLLIVNLEDGEKDPEIRTWFLIRHNYLPFLLCGAYVLFSTYAGPAIMNTRKPFHLRKQMIFYNFSLVVIYTICLLIILWNCQYLTLKQFCKEVKVKKGDVTYLMCNRILLLDDKHFLDSLPNEIRRISRHYPEIRSWFLIRNNYLPFILCGSYALFSTILGPALMRNRKPFDLRTFMVVFNFFLVITYTIALLVAFWYLPQYSREEFCKGGRVEYGNTAHILATTGWVVYMLKYIEFLDTVFFILRKKENQITFLHVVHHTVVPIIAWVIFRTEKTGMQSIPGIINSIIHVIMYSYYGLAAMGPRVRKYLWWKKYLTQLQMIQFFLIILFVAILAPLSGCNMVLSSYIMDIIIAPLFLYLFYKYYKSSFQPKRKSVEINGNVKNGLFRNGTTTNGIYTNGEVQNNSLTNGKSKKHE